ncbi:MAG: type II secretion system F family protein [Lachnospiraceae bacterium]|nr:type II secretion system F family protein [Lachnospiraceae bacterium]
MAAYAYEAADAFGNIKKGSLEADSVELARQKLKSQDLIAVKIKEQSLFTRDINFEIGGYPTARDLSVFSRQFVSMSRAGVSILECLKLLIEQTENKQLKNALIGVRANVEKGETLSESLKAFPKVFPELMVNMVAAGEASGSMDVSFERMASQFEKTAKIKAMIKKAMIYPVVVMIVAIIVVVVMLVVVIPRYTSMFAELGTELPGITKGVVAMSDFIRNNWLVIVPVVAGALIGVKAWSSTSSGKHFFHKLKLELPVMKGLEVKKSSSLMARTLSTLMAAGVPMSEAVEMTANTMDNVYFKEAMEKCHDDIIIGQPLSRPLEECGQFPPMVYHMTRIGEESGNVEEMLNKTADYYDEEVEMAVQSMMAALEPLIIILLAAIVGTLIAACLAPMLTMYNTLNTL